MHSVHGAPLRSLSLVTVCVLQVPDPPSMVKKFAALNAAFIPSLQFPLGGGASARVAWRLPLDQDVSGMQLVPGEGFVAEVGWVF